MLELRDPATLVRGDRDELLRVAENLIENAIKYGAPDTGEPERRGLGRSRRRATAMGVLEVRDEGPGIAPENIPRLTERFYRVDVGQSRAKGGTGLGLALVKHILARHRGRLGIQCDAGARRDVFTACVPLDKPNRAALKDVFAPRPCHAIRRAALSLRFERPAGVTQLSSGRRRFAARQRSRRVRHRRRSGAQLTSEEVWHVEHSCAFRLLAAARVGAAASALAADISGAGATFPYPIYAKWADTYKKETGNGLNYQSIGSGGGIKQIKANTVTFGATDKPLKPEDLEGTASCSCRMVMGGDRAGHQPRRRQRRASWCSTARPSPRSSSARSRPGTIRRSPSSIRALKLPEPPIAVVHRSDGSGTTFNFTNYLSKVSADWKTKVGADAAGGMAGRPRRQGQ